ncbi:MAG TPA: hypothetical protein PKA11_03295, partial [Accumulibacter sp.]|nr:hypothetical protein [Accumulibacter sp.]
QAVTDLTGGAGDCDAHGGFGHDAGSCLVVSEKNQADQSAKLRKKATGELHGTQVSWRQQTARIIKCRIAECQIYLMSYIRYFVFVRRVDVIGKVC